MKTQQRNLERRVKDAVKDGAHLLHGNDRQGALYPPTVIDHVPYTSELVLQETFGPVIPIIRVPNDIESVIRISNSTAFGSVVRRLHEPSRLHHAVCERARRRHCEYLGSPWISDRDVAVRRHKRFWPWIQGRRSRKP